MRIVSGSWAGRRIEAPSGRETRPTSDRVREAWMSAIAEELRDARVLDLYAGSGALGLEALSRGAREVTFIERAPAAARVIERNVAALGAPEGSTRVIRKDAIRFLDDLEGIEYDVAFADPPYRQGIPDRLVSALSERPFARLLCIEHSRDEAVASPLVIWQRKYGDTMLTFYRAE